MSLLSDLRTALLDAVGMPIIYVGAAEQGATLPYAVLSRMETDRVRGLPGPQSLALSEWELAVYTARVSERETFRSVARKTIETLGPWRVHGGTLIQSAAVINDFDDEVPPSDGSDQPRRRAIFQFQLWAGEPL
jgi:hypothetical protein